jgi:hypothetical protein
MDNKVYCKKCKHCNDFTFIGCGHDKNIRFVSLHSKPFITEVEEFSTKNKLNDCKDFAPNFWFKLRKVFGL